MLRLLGAAWLLGLPAFSRAAPESAPRLVPSWIAALDRSDRAVLVWIHDHRFASVRVYRSTPGAQPEFKLIGETRESTFEDTRVVAGGVYRYRLTAVDARGREGPPSQEMGVRIAAKVVRRPPVKPVWMGYLPVGNGVTLKWAEQEGADVIAYNIYRRTPPGTEFTLVSSAKGTSFTDTGLQPGQPVIYAITALDSTFVETPFSEELSVTYVPYQAPATPGPTWRLRRTRLVAMVTRADQPLLRPADVAVGPLSGSVYLADSGRNRIFVFNANGEFVRSIGGGAGGPSELRRVTGLGMGRDETVYAVDPGQAAVFAFGSQGGAGRRIPVPGSAPAAPGLVDCAVGGDGGLFVVDNANHTVLLPGRWGGPAGFGSAGFGAGEFSAPTFCSTDAEGNLYVADTLNARVQVFSGAGEFVRAFGRSRRGPGGMLRPKGVAVAANGEVYVADSWQNSIQVFSGTGQLVAILADESGAPLDLGSPNGISLGAGNRIYIAERLSARLQIREILDEAP